MAQSPPSSPFYWNDYFRDTRILSLAAKGTWMDILCHLHESATRGSATLTLAQWAGWCGCPQGQFIESIEELQKAGIATVTFRHTKITSISPKSSASTTDESNGASNLPGNTLITVANRRMVREEHIRKSNALRQERFRGKQRGNDDTTDAPTLDVTPPVTPPVPPDVTAMSQSKFSLPSSSSSSSSGRKEKEILKEKESAAASLGAPSQGPLGVGSEPPEKLKPSQAEKPGVRKGQIQPAESSLKIHSLAVDTPKSACGYHSGVGYACAMPVAKNALSRPRCAWHFHVEHALNGIGSYADFEAWHAGQLFLGKIPVGECWQTANREVGVPVSKLDD